MPFGIVIRQRPTEPDANVIAATAKALGIDNYTARQRLKGRGLAFLLRSDSPDDRFKKVVSQLSHLGIDAYQIDLSKRIRIQRCTAVGIENGRVVLQSRDNAVAIGPEHNVLIVATEFSGKVERRFASRQMHVSKNSPIAIDTQEILDQILLSPTMVIDVLVTKDDRLEGAFRLFPGKFGIDGMKESATVSAVQNIKAIIEHISNSAGFVEIDVDFALSSLPNASGSAVPSSASVESKLKVLGRYDSIRLDVFLQDRSRTARNETNQSIPGVVAGVPIGEQKDSVIGEFLGQSDDEPAVGSGSKEDVSRAAPHDVYSESGNVDVASAKILPPPPMAPIQGAGETLQGGPFALIFGAIGILSISMFFVPLLMQSKGAEIGDIAVYWIIHKGIGFFLISAVMFLGSFYCIKIKRIMQNTPTSKVRSMPAGMVEIKGEAERMYNVLSPVSHLPCVWWRFSKYRKRHGNKGETRWTLVNRMSSSNMPFLLRDETGAVEINPLGANMVIRNKETIYGGVMVTGGFEHMALLGEDEKVVEEIIPEGAEIYVLGFAYPKKKTDSLSQKVANKLAALKRNQKELLDRFDLNHDGKIDADEWDLARQSAEREAIAETLKGEEPDKPNVPQSTVGLVVGKSPTKGIPFIIAHGSEEGMWLKFSVCSVVLFGLTFAFAITGVVMYLSSGSFEHFIK